MARPLRIEYPGAVYHVTSRGNEKKEIFRDNSDRESFLNMLFKVNDRYNWICHAYCLMDNHYHIVVETPDGNLSLGMRQLNGVYTQAFNRRHVRTGHLFQGRFKAILIQKDSHLLEVCRYVALNPVRARAVENPNQWQWSSYQATAGLVQSHQCLTREWILLQFGSVLSSAEQEYRDFVNEGIDQASIWQKVKAQSILGREDFPEDLVDYIKGHKDIIDIPRSQRYLARPGLESLFTDNVLHDILQRDEMIAEAVNGYGYRQREVADHLGMHFSSISRIMRNKMVMLRK
jgi:putative transposase